MRKIFACLFSVLLLSILPGSAAYGAGVNLRDMDYKRVHPDVRIKDIVEIEGARSNQLSGIGIVTGLSGTGDKSPMAMQMMRNMMKQHGITLDEKAARSKNIAVVSLTADLPPMPAQGRR